MPDIQVIHTAAGEELVVLPRADYDALCALANEAAEDAADIAIYHERMAQIRAGEDEWLPVEVSALMIKGNGLLRSLRLWRGLSQVELAARAGVGQGYLSDLETKRRSGAAETMEKLAAALDVPGKWLLP
jgi:DNA-binding Xre family transcriptional regulator